jgi:beta-lactamase regulating signal transducer with metallopeptidase domain
MTEFSQMLNHPFVETLGWSLIHFLWQGILLALVAAAVLLTLKNASAALRYGVACVAFLLMAAAPAVTAWHVVSNNPALANREAGAAEIEIDEATQELNGSLVTDGSLPGTNSEHAANVAPIPAPGSMNAASNSGLESARLRSWLTTLVGCWLIGVTALSLRLISTLVGVSKLRSRHTSFPAETLARRVEALARRLSVSRPVRLAQSALVEVPTVIGVLRPLILLPATAMTGLSAEQLDAILAHEIAHIRRHDYFINLIQTVIETLLFYHPAVWWLSRRIRQERENCCDDIASDVCENPIRYAEALVRMEELRAPTGGLAMAATGGSLALRIRRLLGQSAHESSSQNWWIGGLVSLLIVVALILTVVSQTSETLAEERGHPQAADLSAVPQQPSDEADSNDEIGPLTPAQIADLMEESMRRYSTIDMSGELAIGDGADSDESSDEVDGTFRYQSVGERFLAEQRGPSPTKGSWLREGFDGKVHYHGWGMLRLGEEDGRGQTISARKLFFSLDGRHVPQKLRYENAKIVDETTIDGIKCLVIESSFSRSGRTSTYSMTVAPDHSWLPLNLTSSFNGEITARKTLNQIEKINDVWIARKITSETTHKSVTFPSETPKTRRIRITEFSAKPEFDDAVFELPIGPGTNVMDYRVGYGWHEGPWWNELKPWLQKKYGWPRPDLFELHSMSHHLPKPRSLELAPPIEPAKWLTPEPGGWDRPERKLTLLYFFGGRLISPTPKWAGAINELHRRYRKYGFEVIGIAAATDAPELPRQTAKELNLGFPVGIDQKSDKGYGKTFSAYGLPTFYYHGLFFVDHEGIVQSVKQGEPSQVKVDGKEFKISHIETKVIDLLKKAGVENVEPQVLPPDIFDIKTHNEVLAEWRRLRAAAPKDASVVGRVTFNGAPVAAASIKLQPTMTIMSSNTGHGFMLFPDRAGTITVPTNLDGTYELKNLTKGEYKFTCSAKGMKIQDRTIQIGADLPTVNVDVGLAKN